MIYLKIKVESSVRKFGVKLNLKKRKRKTKKKTKRKKKKKKTLKKGIAKRLFIEETLLFVSTTLARF